LLFSGRSLRDLGGFGLTLFASRLLSYLNLNGDNLLIGRFLGSRALGIYSLSYSVMFTPIVRIEAPIMQVVFPAYARLQSDPPRMGLAWLRSKRMAAALQAPLFFALLVEAPDIVSVVFGEKWRAAVPVMQLLCAAGIANTVVTLNWTVLQARGQAGTLLRLNLFMTSVIVGAFALGLTWGIIGVAACYAVAKWLLILPETWVTARSVSLGVIRSLRASAEIVLIAAGAGLLALGLRAALVAGGVPAGARLVIVLAFGAIAYLALVSVAAPDLVREVKGLRTTLRRRRGLQSTPVSAE
jgi:O-antigen/teichoic acid export membrane protein